PGRFSRSRLSDRRRWLSIHLLLALLKGFQSPPFPLQGVHLRRQLGYFSCTHEQLARSLCGRGSNNLFPIPSLCATSKRLHRPAYTSTCDGEIRTRRSKERRRD